MTPVACCCRNLTKSSCSPAESSKANKLTYTPLTNFSTPPTIAPLASKAFETLAVSAIKALNTLTLAAFTLS